MGIVDALSSDQWPRLVWLLTAVMTPCHLLVVVPRVAAEVTYYLSRMWQIDTKPCSVPIVQTWLASLRQKLSMLLLLLTLTLPLTCHPTTVR